MMDPEKQATLVSAGYVFTDAEDFLGLTEEERLLLDIRLAVSRAVRDARLARNLTQAQAAKILKTSQPNVSKIESAAADVSLDLMFRSLFSLGGSAADVFGELPRGKIGKGADVGFVPLVPLLGFDEANSKAAMRKKSNAPKKPQRG
jgi:transcriptional regulator with XRE-family HTH domain